MTADKERRTPAEHQPGPNTYYRYPSMKEPRWGWEVVAYFFLGGVAAGAHLLATLAHLFGAPEDRPVARAGRYIALGAVAVSPILLITDLGRPRRFGNMLRILKTRSPMSVGTWGMTGFVLFAGLGALRQAVEDGLVSRRSVPARLAARVPLAASGVLGTLAAFFVGSYTGVLLSFTNAPLWARNRLLQGPLYLTSALSSGVAAITAALAAGGRVAPRTEAWLGRVSDAAAVGELGLTAGSLAALGANARPMLRPRYALPFWLGSVGLGIVAPLLLRRNIHKATTGAARARLLTAGLAALAGGLIFRWVTVAAGRESARSPQEYLTFTKRAGR